MFLICSLYLCTCFFEEHCPSHLFKAIFMPLRMLTGNLHCQKIFWYSGFFTEDISPSTLKCSVRKGLCQQWSEELSPLPGGFLAGSLSSCCLMWLWEALLCWKLVPQCPDWSASQDRGIPRTPVSDSVNIWQVDPYGTRTWKPGNEKFSSLDRGDKRNWESNSLHSQ